MRFTLILALLALAGCSSPPTGLSAELPGTAWTLERVVYADGRVARGTGERVTFEPDGRVLVVSCNTCNGTYRMRGNELAVRSPMACTLRACADGAVELERYLDGDLTLQRDGAYLIMEGVLPDSPQLHFLPVSGAISSSPVAM